MNINTKERILKTALKLFNNRGYSNVTMRDISDELKISLGNLTYHYKKKKDLMMDLLSYQYNEFRSIDLKFDVSLSNLHNHFITMKIFREKYHFYFSSFSELPKYYPELELLQRTIVTEFYNLYIDVFDKLQNQGVLSKEVYKGHYEDLALSILALNMYGVQEFKLIEEILSREKSIVRTIWASIIPCLTQVGLEQYEKICTLY